MATISTSNTQRHRHRRLPHLRHRSHHDRAPNNNSKPRPIEDVAIIEEPNRRYRPSMEDACVAVENYRQSFYDTHPPSFFHRHRFGGRHRRMGGGYHHWRTAPQDSMECFFGVYDGHGGRTAVDVIKQVMHKCFEEALVQQITSDSIYKKYQKMSKDFEKRVSLESGDGGGDTGVEEEEEEEEEGDELEEGENVKTLIQNVMVKSRMQRGFYNRTQNWGGFNFVKQGLSKVRQQRNDKKKGNESPPPPPPPPPLEGGRRNVSLDETVFTMKKQNGEANDEDVENEDDEFAYQRHSTCGNDAYKRRMVSLDGIRTDPKRAFKQAYRAVDEILLSKGCLGSGATAVTCYLCPNPANLETGQDLYTANCGDARAVLVRDGKAVRLSHDHKPTDMTELKRVRKGGGFIASDRVNGILSVARALGDHSMKSVVVSKPYVSEIQLTKSDTALILACDGLWDVLTDEQAADLVDTQLKKNHSAENAARKLTKMALALNSTDNISVVVVKLLDHGPKSQEGDASDKKDKKSAQTTGSVDVHGRPIQYTRW